MVLLFRFYILSEICYISISFNYLLSCCFETKTSLWIWWDERFNELNRVCDIFYLFESKIDLNEWKADWLSCMGVASSNKIESTSVLILSV